MKSSEQNYKNLEPLPKKFFLKDTATVAQNLLGKGLLLSAGDAMLLCEVVEVEAYLGDADPASHAYRGLTKRNWAMFEEGGTCYVYVSYGINFCMNVATREKGVGQAVLFRALRPLQGTEKMQKNRGNVAERHLTSGPGKLTQALGIDLSYNGFTFDRPDFRLVDLETRLKSSQIGLSPRIGISKAQDWPLRFFIKSSPWLSRK